MMFISYEGESHSHKSLMYMNCATASSSQMLFHNKYQVIVYKNRPLMLLELNCTLHTRGRREKRRNQSETRSEGNTVKYAVDAMKAKKKIHRYAGDFNTFFHYYVRAIFVE